MRIHVSDVVSTSDIDPSNNNTNTLQVKTIKPKSLNNKKSKFNGPKSFNGLKKNKKFQKRRKEEEESEEEEEEENYGIEEFEGEMKPPLQWKKVKVPQDMMDLSSLFGLEEIEGYDVDRKTGLLVQVGEKGSQKKRSLNETEDEQLETQPNKKLKKTKKQKLEEKRKLKQKQKKKQNQDKVENLEENEEEVNHGEVDEIDGGEEGEDENRIEEEEEEKEGEVKEVKEVKRKQLNHEKFLENEKKKAQEMENLPEIDMSEWNQYNIHHKILKGLQYMKFQNPTPIQKECLSIAINEKKDIIGSAQTGSGKTLAFGIPILSYLAKREDYLPESGGILKSNQLSSLILTPTRELAVQVKDHLTNIARFTNIQIQTIVGGISVEKQLRLLLRQPDIVVATPGRFWELFSSGGDYLKDLSKIKFFVLDEADRMIEEGHFKELDQIIEVVKQGEFNPETTEKDFMETIDSEEREKFGKKEKGKKKREKYQTFLFSATLTLGEVYKKQVKGKKKKTRNAATLENLISRMNFTTEPTVVDVSTKGIMASNLSESCIYCTVEEKDLYLYYFLMRFPGRTIIFVNSIDCLRRLNSLLKVLQLPVGTLHAQMSQGQRLKALEKFHKLPNSLIIATDVASRGLDVQNIQYVIHYQLSRSPDIYVHRSGRTARGESEGMSFVLISPDDMDAYKKTCKVLGKDGLKEFPVEFSYFPPLKKRLKIAVEIDKAEHSVKKKNDSIGWLKKNAAAMEIDLDDDLLDEGENSQVVKTNQRVKSLKAELNHLLKQPIIPFGNSSRYLTSGVIRNLPQKLLSAETKLIAENDTKSAITALHMKKKRY